MKRKYVSIANKKNLNMASKDNNTKRYCSGSGKKFDIFVLQSVSEKKSNVEPHRKTAVPGSIPYVDTDTSLNSLRFVWKAPESGSLEGLTFVLAISPSIKPRDLHAETRENVFEEENFYEYTFNGLSPGRTYRLQIVAYNKFGAGPHSKWIETTTRCSKPMPPEMKCLEFGLNHLKLWWGDIEEEEIEYYIIELQINFKRFVKIYESNGLHFTLSNLNKGTSYSFRIRAVDKKGSGPNSKIYTFATGFRLPPSVTVQAISMKEYYGSGNMQSSLVDAKLFSQHLWVPNYKAIGKENCLASDSSSISKIDVYSSETSLYLSWTPSWSSSAIISYNIDFDGYLFNTRETKCHVILTHLLPNRIYRTRVQAVYEHSKGLFSQVLQATTFQAIPEPPKLNCKDIGPNYLKLVWVSEKKKDILSYKIEILGIDSFIEVYQGPSCNYLLHSLNPCTAYLFRTSVFCSSGRRSLYSPPYVFNTDEPFDEADPCEDDGMEPKDEELENEEEDGTEFSEESNKDKINFRYPPNLDGIQVGYNDFRCLDESKYLNDTIIDFYLRYLLREKVPKCRRQNIHVFNIFFALKLQRVSSLPSEPNLQFREAQYNLIERWTKDVDLFAKDFIILPMNVETHWVVAIICYPRLVTGEPVDGSHQSLVDGSSVGSASGTSQLKTEKVPCIYVFDSCHKYTEQVSSPEYIPNLLRDFLELQSEYGRGRKTVFNKDTIPDFYVTCPQQRNRSDCGIYMLQNVEKFLESPICCPTADLKNWYTKNEMAGKRLEIKYLILELWKFRGYYPKNEDSDTFRLCTEEEVDNLTS